MVVYIFINLFICLHIYLSIYLFFCVCVLEVKAHSFAIITSSLSRSLDVGAVLASHTFDNEARLQVLWGAPTTTCRILILHLGVADSTNASIDVMHDMNNLTLRHYIKEADIGISDNIKRERSTSNTNSWNTNQNVNTGKTTPTTSDGRKFQHNKGNSNPQITTNIKRVFRYG